MKRVAVLGGGPAGAFAAHQLAKAGVETFVLDEKLAWEKPCGGGVTYKAYEKYPFLLHNDTPKKRVTQTFIGAPQAGAAPMTLRHPLLIYSRFDLNQMMLKRAERAGAKLEKTRVLELKREDSRWRIRTRNGELDVDYCIVATGARNPLRDVGTVLRPADAMIALGYYVPGAQHHMEIEFLAQLEGYIWVFPRHDHRSIGICGKGEPAHVLRARLEGYMRSKGIDFTDAQFYSHLLPALEAPAWKSNRIAGDGWMAVGDAAGLVDPITGEGLYYAMRSADLATESIIKDESSVRDLGAVYRRALHHDFGQDLAFGASIARRVFLGNYLFKGITTRMVEFMRSSPLFTDVIHDLFCGVQSYGSLKRRLLIGFPRIHSQVISHALRQKRPSGLGIGNASA